MRQTAYKHEVKKHKRRTKKGKIITVRKHEKGSGIPRAHKSIKRNRSLIPKREGKVSYTVVEALNRRRTTTARKVDQGLRAPLTKDYHLWIHAPNEYDVLGVDSPGGFTQVEDVDVSKYQYAQLSMNQIGQIYRVDVWGHDGKRIVDKFGFKKQKEAIGLVKKIREQKNDKKKGVEASYNLATGWMRIVFDEKPSRDTLDLLKGQGFRYRPRSKAWAAKQNYHREKLLESLAGEVKEVDIPIGHEGKAEYYQSLADRTQGKADDRYDTAKKKMDLIPFGQPILVGHHSEKRHRSDLKKIETGMRKSIELSEKADKYQKTADRHRAKAEGRENPVTILNRIEKHEKNLKKLKSYKGEEAKRMIPRVERLLANEREKYKQSGGIVADKITFKVGDKIRTQFGPAVINKVNKKTLRVTYLGGHQKGKSFWEDRKMDIREVGGMIPKTSFADPILDQYIKSENNLVEVKVKNKDPKMILRELSYRIKDRGFDNKIKVSQRRNEVYLERVK